MSKELKRKNENRARRARRIRGKIAKVGAHRLSVFRSLKHIYVQLISPCGEKTLASASTHDVSDAKQKGNVAAAKKVGALIAKRAIKAGVTKVAFDSSGFKYHGRVQALADAAREQGLNF